MASPATGTLAPAAALGLIEGIYNRLADAVQLVGSPWAKDIGQRRRLAVGGYTATAVLSSLIGTCQRTAMFAQSSTGEEDAQHRRSLPD